MKKIIHLALAITGMSITASSLTACATSSTLQNNKDIEQIEFPVAQVFRDIYLKGSEDIFQLKNIEDFNNQHFVLIEKFDSHDRSDPTLITLDNKQYIEVQGTECYLQVDISEMNTSQLKKLVNNCSIENLGSPFINYLDPKTFLYVGEKFEDISLITIPSKVYSVPEYATINSSGNLSELESYDTNTFPNGLPKIKSSLKWTIKHVENVTDKEMPSTAKLCSLRENNYSTNGKKSTISHCYTINISGDILKQELTIYHSSSNSTRYLSTPTKYASTQN